MQFVLSLNPEEVYPKYKSGAYQLERAISKGHQEYSTDKTKWPLNKPIPKLEALNQCAGMFILFLFAKFIILNSVK